MNVISVIVGSTREGRFSEKPARWILKHLKNRDGVDARLLDLRDFPMPFFDQPVSPATPGSQGKSNCDSARSASDVWEAWSSGGRARHVLRAFGRAMGRGRRAHLGLPRARSES